MPMIFKYDFDLGRYSSSTWRELMSFEFFDILIDDRHIRLLSDFVGDDCDICVVRMNIIN